MSVELNAPQGAAVTHFGSPLLIIAGAGAGKTLVLTRRMVYMMTELGIPGDRILAITFTNKAASEMRHRTMALCQSSQSVPFIGTFHSFCNQILRESIHALGRSNQFTIIDATDQNRLIKQIAQPMALDDKKYPPAMLLRVLDRLKNAMIPPATYARDPRMDPVVLSVYEAYQGILTQQNALDFNDLISQTVQLFQGHPSVLDRYQEQYYAILVDEYQDTNPAQFSLLHLLSQKYRNITAVGDFDQSIYSWRGASVQTILQFEQQFPDATMIKLEENFRSTPTILAAANALIANNTQRKEKNLWTKNQGGTPIEVIRCQDDRDEGRQIADRFMASHQSGRPYTDMAVLVRTNAQTRVIEETFSSRHIPYRVIGGFAFMDRAEIKDMGAYLRCIHNRHDDSAVIRALGVPSRGVGQTSLSKLMAIGAHQQMSLFQIVQSGINPIGNRQWESIRQFFDTLNQLDQQYQQDTEPTAVANLIHAIIASTQYDQYLVAQPNGLDRLEVLNELIHLAKEEITDLGEFITRLSLGIHQDEVAPNAVSILTLHHAKGLEFPLVCLAGLEEGILPHSRSIAEGNIEEERRLCYVGITRGKEHVIITTVGSRMFQGEKRRLIESRFLDEIPSELITGRGHGNSRPPRHNRGAHSPTNPPQNIEAPSYAIHDRVQHSRWGMGHIVAMSGEGENAVLTVSFGGEHKRLIAKYAPLRKG